MRKLLLPIVMSLAAATGCYTQGDVGATYSVGYAAPAPQLYYYAPGVSVVAYSDDPVFYSDGLYYRYYNGGWYSSSYYGGGWVAAYNVPYGVRSIDRPYSYAHFQPGRGWTRVNAGYSGGGYYNNGPTVRDHRSYNGGYSSRPAPTYRSYAPVRSAPSRGPVVRDHRR